MWNQNNRKPINYEFRTLHFKTLWPDFTVFKESLERFKITKPDFLATEGSFAALQQMIGNSELRYTTAEKNLGYFALLVKQLNFTYERKKKIAEIDITRLNSTNTKSEQKLLLVNRTDTSGTENSDLVDKFLDNTVINETTTTGPALNTIQTMQEMAEIEDPEIWFLTSLANSMAYPLVRTHKGKEFVY